MCACWPVVWMVSPNAPSLKIKMPQRFPRELGRGDALVFSPKEVNRNHIVANVQVTDKNGFLNCALPRRS